MVHTAPTLLLFPPTVGPFATGDATPAKHDLSGQVPKYSILQWWIQLILLMTQLAFRRTMLRLDKPPSPGGPQTSYSSAHQLLASGICDYHFNGPCCTCFCRWPLCIAHHSEPKSMGCFQSYIYSPLHERPYVQSYPQSSLRCLWWQRRHHLLCRWVFKPAGNGNSNNCCYM